MVWVTHCMPHTVYLAPSSVVSLHARVRLQPSRCLLLLPIKTQKAEQASCAPQASRSDTSRSAFPCLLCRLDRSALQESTGERQAMTMRKPVRTSEDLICETITSF